MIPVRKCRYEGIAYQCNKPHFCTFTTVLTFTELATYSVSVVKSDFGNFCGIKSINPFIALGHAHDAYRF